MKHQAQELDDFMSQKELKEAVETVLFATSRALSPRRITELTGDRYSSKEVRDMIRQLNSEFEETGRIFRIEQVGDGFQMRTLARCSKWIRKLETVKTIKLSMATMETLSIIAYKQPVTRAGIEYIRGVDSSHTIRRLIKHKLIRIIGREMVPGRPSIYSTTKYFLEIFGLTNLKHLPALAELQQAEVSQAQQLEMPLENEQQTEESASSEPTPGLMEFEEQPNDEIKNGEDGEEKVF